MKTSAVRDAKGKELKPLVIVGMSDPHGPWSEYQGLVVDPNSNIEDEEYTVAVYFFDEVHKTRFNYFDLKEGIMHFDEWAEFSSKELKRGNYEFLLKDDAWKRSPRVIFFKPEELVVMKDWKLESLIDRLFDGSYHQYRELAAKYPKDPAAYRCFIQACKNNASKLALFNVWGTVFPLYVCETCMPEVNGWRGDDLPKMKPIESCLIAA